MSSTEQQKWSNEEVIEWVKQLQANGMPDSIIYATVTKRIVSDFREQLAAAKLKAETAMECAEIMKAQLEEANTRLHEMGYHENWQEDDDNL